MPHGSAPALLQDVASGMPFLIRRIPLPIAGTMRNSRRSAGLAGCLVVAAFGLTGCGATPPVGLRKDGESITVVMGGQCAPASYLWRLDVQAISEETRDVANPTMWQIETGEPRRL